MNPPADRVDGLILVNKPSGPTSYDMIRWVKRHILGAKVGHCGTLDPLASGLMILLLGPSTKRQFVYMGHEKIYRCVMRCGIQTDTGDILGEILGRTDCPALDPLAIETHFKALLGPQLQTPPMYSALKQHGTPLYKLAREGKVVDRRPRTIEIFSLHLIDVQGPDITFRVRCSAGTYVRTLSEEIARRLGTCGTMLSLEREAIGSFRLEDAIPGDHLRTMSETEFRVHVKGS